VSKAKEVNVPRESGATQLPKGHEKPCYSEGPQHNKAKGHELPAKTEGGHERKDKSQVHVEDTTHHSGRQHPPATVLSDSKLLGQNAYGGKLRKSDEGKGKK
jgi:hypothetical protein